MNQTVVDSSNYRHQLVKLLGRGGQGAVFLTADPNVVIKARVKDLDYEVICNEAAYDAFAAAIEEVRVLPLPPGLHVARPVHLLKRPACGYVMRMMSDMVPIRKLFECPPETNLGTFYRDTGGLRRRLTLLAEAARVLARLHSLPVVYGDISAENLFVSGSKEAHEVWLIDSDNMRYTTDFRKTIFTPGYGAPEIKNKTSCNSPYSDCFSFAILAFEVLAQVSPFAGELVEAGGGWDADDSANYREKAERGEMPWVEDDEDDSNFTEKGLPGSIVLSGNLRALFQQTLGKEGRTNPASRPAMRRWYEVLRQAADATVLCGECGQTFYFHPDRDDKVCPFCGKPRNQVLFASMYDACWDAEEKVTSHVTPRGGKVFDLLAGGTGYLYSFQTDDALLESQVEPRFELEFKGEFMTLLNQTGREVTLHHKGKHRRLGPHGLYDDVRLDGLQIHMRLDEARSRHIAFTLI